MFLGSDNLYVFVVSATMLCITELVYFRLADKYNIIDKPNQRSSHVTPTIRGGGMIFVLAVLGWSICEGFIFSKFTAGMLLIGTISFLDDVKEQPARVRLAIHAVAIALMFSEVGFFDNEILLIGIAFIVVVGAINAFNFMDGINGITGIYAAVNFLTFIFIQEFMLPFTKLSLLTVALAGVAVFLFFNFRRKARCFAGDVGSVTLAFLQIFFLLQLIQSTLHFSFVLFFLVFGVDSVITIINRLIKRENIFKPHRTHLYQFMANEYRLPHRLVSSLYGLLQLAINAGVLYLFLNQASIGYYLILGIAYTTMYTIVRVNVVRRLSGQLN